MPAIEKSRRDALNPVMVAQAGQACQHTGELVYVLYRIALSYAHSRQENPRFQDWFEAWGALKMAAAVLYDGQVAIYEDRKFEENGDI